MARITLLLDQRNKVTQRICGIILICFVMTGAICHAQPEVLEFTSKSCPLDGPLPYHFEKSLASKKLLNHMVFEKELSHDTLSIALGVYGYCNNGDTAGVKTSGDTLFLLYGPEVIAHDDGKEIMVELCLCLLRFHYKIIGLDNTRLIVLENTSFGFKSEPLDVINSEAMSFHYKTEADLLNQFQQYIKRAKAHYAHLLSLYEGLNMNIDEEDWNEYWDNINSEWEKLLNNIQAVEDPYVAVHLDSYTYNFLKDNFTTEMKSITVNLLKEYNRLEELGVYEGGEKPPKKVTHNK